VENTTIGFESANMTSFQSARMTTRTSSMLIDATLIAIALIGFALILENA
jgi:hypothetical protein